MPDILLLKVDWITEAGDEGLPTCWAPGWPPPQRLTKYTGVVPMPMRAMSAL